jgi:flagellar biosynthesis protein FlhF
VVSAATQADDVESFVEALNTDRALSLLITKSDEAGSFPPYLAFAYQNRIPVSYVANGPDVPEDLSIPTTDDLAESMLPSEVKGDAEVAP